MDYIDMINTESDGARVLSRAALARTSPTKPSPLPLTPPFDTMGSARIVVSQ